jgi:hypothetical protein
MCHFRKLMDEWSLRGENLVGIGTDGANVMSGNCHSLVTLLKRTWPHIIHIKCVCHSIDLIAKHAGPNVIKLFISILL